MRQYVKMLSTSSGPSWYVGVFSAFRAEAVAIDQLSLLVTEAPLLLVVREGRSHPANPIPRAFRVPHSVLRSTDSANATYSVQG